MSFAPPPDAAAVATLAAATELADLVARGWELHAEHPHEVAAALRTRAPACPADGAGADAIGLAEHVLLSHLGDESALRSFLAALPPALAAAPATAAAAQRAGWVLARLEGSEPPEIPAGLAWRAMQSLWSVWAARGRAAEAQAMLAAEVPQAMACPDAAARRGLAATCNNLALELRLGRRGDAALDALMLAAAEASHTLWASAGTWVHAERAHYQLARCHAVLGHGPRALAHAQECLSLIEKHAEAPEATPLERFFAHEALAWAHRAAGALDAAATQRARMAALLEEVTDADERAWGRQTLADLDRAPG